MKTKSSIRILSVFLILAASLAAGWLIAWTGGDPRIEIGGWITGLVLLILTLGLAGLWKLAGGGKTLAWLLAGAFLLRLAVGAGLDWGLPRYGYPANQEHQHGYFYTDAYRRDTSALGLARSDRPLVSAFTEDFGSDQYGGLLSLSAWIYRYLSPDAARPHLVTIIGAAAGSAGLMFVWAAVRRRWGAGRGLAVLAALVYALYPQNIILSATQMREPYLISAAAGVLWAMQAWYLPVKPDDRKKAAIVMAASLLVMVVFSSRIALVAVAVAALYFLWEAASRLPARLRPLLAAGALVTVLLGLGLTWNWLRFSALYDTYLAEKQSGWVQQIFKILPEQAQVPFIVGYGLMQPVLPAAISDLALPVLVPAGDPARVDLAPGLVRQVNFWLALGWYAILPGLVYTLFAARQADSPENRRLLILAAAFVLLWAVISSARAGGDQWDNPRYRTIFIAWQAVVFAWGLQHARRLSGPWLGRLYLVEGIFLLFFTEWYISRYSRLVGRPSFFMLLGAIAGLSLLVIIGGWLWDRRQRKQPGLTNPAEKL